MLKNNLVSANQRLNMDHSNSLIRPNRFLAATAAQVATLAADIAVSNQIKSNQIYFSAAGNNNTQYKSIDLKYEIPLLKEWMVSQADTNTTPNL